MASSGVQRTISSQSGNGCEHVTLIRRQFVKIESLESELAIIRLERDALAGENERLHFQLQCLNQSNNPHKSREVDSRIDSSSLSSQGKTFRVQSQSGSQCSARESISGAKSDYELSQQLIEKRVNALERKYGGLVARESAIRIQRAFRTYRLKKRFQSIAFQALRGREGEERDRERHVTIEERRTSIKEREDSASTRSDDSSRENVFIPESLMSSASAQNSSSSSQLTAECQRKRQYRVGLNLFNKQPPERGIHFLLNNGFIESAQTIESQTQLIARFLLTRKGLSKAMIGEYVATNQSFNQHVMRAFTREIDLSNLGVDGALRKFQTYFRFPGEAQKIERLVDAFATRYIECNSSECLSRDSVFILSFAIIMLNTDLHAPTNSRNRMTPQQWLSNLKHVFSGGDADHLSDQLLLDIYSRIKGQELRTGADHVTQVAKVQSAIVATSKATPVPNLCLESRRLVCYCRLYEIRDLNRKESKDRHQREVFLFNDLLLVTKLSARAKSSHQMPEYLYRESISLSSLSLTHFSSQFHRFGITLRRRLLEDTPIIHFNARNELDRKRFSDDLKESILESNEMDKQRIQKSNSLLALNSSCSSNAINNNNNNNTNNANDVNSDPHPPAQRRKSSSGSLDSGLSLPSRDHSPQTAKNT